MRDTLLSLAPFTTFGVEVYANHITTVTNEAQLRQVWSDAITQQQPVFILGEGSNILFLENFLGIVLLNRIKGIVVTEEDTAWRLHVGAGENWHQLVCYTLEQGMPGLENLALIPGCAGAAPIQNIGAYGFEFQQVCDYVDVLDLHNGSTFRLTTRDCQFAYRESVFKSRYRENYAIVAIGLRLPKAWQPTLHYGELAQLSPQDVTPTQIFAAVCQMRTNKLPDPAKKGNAGSFFKNPVVNTELAQKIKLRYPDVPCYPQWDGAVKLAAGWLIDRCELKGFQIGGAAVDRCQALVLINQHQASSSDIIHLARYVRTKVAQTFGVWLEPEVRFVAAAGEINVLEVLS